MLRPHAKSTYLCLQYKKMILPINLTKARPTSIRLWGIDPRVVIQRTTVMRTDLPRLKLGPVGFAPR